LRSFFLPQAFASAIAKKYADAIRLSIHPSADTRKVSISLIPQSAGLAKTPWHGALVRAVNGEVKILSAIEVPSMTHELIHDKCGRPLYFRERSDLFHWPGMDVQFTYLYPNGIMITPKSGSYPISSVDMQKVRGLAEECSPVVLRGFTKTRDRRAFIAKAYDLGDVQSWGASGIIHEVKDEGNEDPGSNSVVSNEAMPMHYDGMFKMKKQIDENGIEQQVSDVPRLQYFVSKKAGPPQDGLTIFASSRCFFQHFPKHYSLNKLSGCTWTVDSRGFFNSLLENQPLVVPHPSKNTPCIRWHQIWQQEKTNFGHATVTIDQNIPGLENLIESVLYDRRVSLYWEWQDGDVLVSDNFSMLHTRTAFKTESSRELWRIHVN